MTRTILVVEDGDEYLEAFRRLASGAGKVEWLHARDAGEARDQLARRRVDAIFLDVVFDRTAPERLVGESPALAERFGDSALLREHLARQQGFYVLAALASAIHDGARVIVAHDFTGEESRLAALRRSVPALEGVAESATTSHVLRRLLAP